MSSRRIAPTKSSNGTGTRLNLVLDSSVSSADLAAEVVAQFARSAGYNESQQDEISLAVRECAANAVVHGNCCDEHK